MSDYLLSVILGIVEGLTDSCLSVPQRTCASRKPCSAFPLGERVLEDVHDRDPARRDSVPADLFPQPNQKFLSTFPSGERGDKTVLTHPLSL